MHRTPQIYVLELNPPLQKFPLGLTCPADWFQSTIVVLGGVHCNTNPYLPKFWANEVVESIEAIGQILPYRLIQFGVKTFKGTDSIGENDKNL